jgi:enamine deaminase RidA (YjgF/YER057c/UK114 family)
MRQLTPSSVRPPFGAYSHGIEVPAGWRLVATSGQLGIRPDETVPEDVAGQARLCFEAIGAILAQAGMGPADVVRIAGYVTDRAYYPAYMSARDAWMQGSGRLPASTLLIVGGFTRAEFLVEVEVLAAAP